MLLCQSCGNGSENGDEPEQKGLPKLQIHIYSQEGSVITRGDTGDVSSETEEGVNSLDIWVFRTDEGHDGELVGYLALQISPTSPFEGGDYQMTVSEEFSTAKPPVDVYVMANVRQTNTGLDLHERAAIDPESVSRSDLDAALLSGTYFGVESPMCHEVPSEGLPMSGILKGAEVTGNSPLLKVEKHVTVVRAVSKVRFVFCRTESQKLTISSIKIDPLLIPAGEYLFLGNPYRSGLVNDRIHLQEEPSYLPAEKKDLLPLSDSDNIRVCTNPVKYVYTVEKQGQTYEDLINAGIYGSEENDPDLSEVGRFYLRETDKKITGLIYYKIDGVEKEPVSFSMAEAGDFTRNHTWIVYGYFAGKESLNISSISVNDWVESSGDHNVHNW